MRFLFFKLILVTSLFVDSVVGQNPVFKPYRSLLTIPIEKYVKQESVGLPQIVGLNSLNDNQLFVANQNGFFTIWDFTNNECLYRCQMDSTIVNTAMYNPALDAIVSNTFLTESHLNLYRNLKDCIKQPLLDTLQNRTYRTISSYGKKIAAVSDSMVLIWSLKDTIWFFKQLQTNDHYFEIAFLNEETLLAGCGNGEILIIDAATLLTKKKIQAHPNYTVAVIAPSLDQKHFASTEGNEVKVWKRDGKSFITLKTQVALIGALQWMSNDILIVGGAGNAIEIWDTRQKKRLQAFNIQPKDRFKPANPHKATGTAYLFASDFNHRVDSLKCWAKITALGVNQNNFITLGYETFDVEVLKYADGIQPQKKMNIFGEINKNEEQQIQALEIDLQGRYLFAGNKFAYTSIDLYDATKRAALAAHYQSYASVNINSFGDIAIVKVDNRMRQYQTAMVHLERNILHAETSKSKLFKAVYDALPKGKKGGAFSDFLDGFHSLENPSGFTVSSDKKYIVQFDAKGLLQICRVEDLKIVQDTILRMPIKKAIFSKNSDFIWLIGANNTIYTYPFLEKAPVLKVESAISSSLKHVSCTGQPFIAFYDDENIDIYDLDQKKIVKHFSNSKKGFSISHVKFMGDSMHLVWVLNENKANSDVISSTSKTSNRMPERIIQKITVSSDEKKIFLGNTVGEIISLTK
jgi:WD40 repeat protein